MKASTKGYRHGYLKDWYGQSQVGGHVHLAVFLFLYTQFANGYVLKTNTVITWRTLPYVLHRKSIIIILELILNHKSLSAILC